LSPQSYRINKCEIKEINHVEAKKFYDQFHYLGGRPAIYHYGAFIAGRLMACISFTRPSRQSNYDYELSRMAADPSFRIHGIWSKMMLIFVKAVEPKKIVTFSDNRLFAGGVYEKMGFKYDGDVKPDYYWVIGDRRLHKSALRKPKGETRTDNEIRTLEGYKKIWDLGKKRWVMDVHHPS
jgi:GNAT superfamily N-acetyltransferase